MSRLSYFELSDDLGRSLALTGDYRMRDWDGLGLVEPLYTLRAGAEQDGATVAHARRSHRVITVGGALVGDTPETLEANKGALEDFLANIATDCYLTAVYADGSRRRSLVRHLGGLTAPWKFEDGERAIRDVVQFLARDPIWYNPEASAWNYSLGVGAGSYEWPLAWPVSWGGSEIDIVETRRYAGSAPERPVIMVHGPAQDLQIRNDSLGLVLDFFGHTIQDDETVTIDLRPGYKRISSDTGETTFADLTTDSNLAHWRIGATNEVINGDNVIGVACVGATVLTRVWMVVYERWAGI